MNLPQGTPYPIPANRIPSREENRRRRFPLEFCRFHFSTQRDETSKSNRLGLQIRRLYEEGEGGMEGQLKYQLDAVYIFDTTGQIKSYVQILLKKTSCMVKYWIIDVKRAFVCMNVRVSIKLIHTYYQHL